MSASNQDHEVEALGDGSEEEQEPNDGARFEIDPAQLASLGRRLTSEQNFPRAVAAGSAAALVGAAVWAAVTFVTGYQIGFMALGVGVVVGFAVREAGQGFTSRFGVLGAALSLAGCVLGNLLAVTALVAQEVGVPFSSALGRLTPDVAQSLMAASFSPIDLVFYGIALYEGYRLAFRQVTNEELERMLAEERGPSRATSR